MCTSRFRTNWEGGDIGVLRQWVSLRRAATRKHYGVNNDVVWKNMLYMVLIFRPGYTQKILKLLSHGFLDTWTERESAHATRDRWYDGTGGNQAWLKDDRLKISASCELHDQGG